ncbi:hypothetical protein PMAYCL1PPCAC_03621, partial [Pristionchus mayeri]
RLRTDGLFSIVFDADEPISLIPSSVFDLLSGDFFEERKIFELSVNVVLVDSIPDSFASRSAPVSIYSGVLKVDDSTEPISKELLATTSSFFNALFYGNFAEHQKGIFEIKEVDFNDFRIYLDLVHQRNWNFSSVDQALMVLCYADRFDMLYLHKHILPYLKTNTLPQDAIKDTFLLFERFKNNQELIAWVLPQCVNVQAAIDLVSECAPSIKMSSIHTALKAINKCVDGAISDSRLAIVKDYLENQELPVLLRCKDALLGPITSEQIFTIKCHGLTSILVNWSNQIWPNIPEKYDTADCEGRTYSRSGSDSARYTSSDILQIHAYHS